MQYITFNYTRLVSVNSKNDAKVGQSVALDISNLNWPIALEQNQIVMTALAKLPDVSSASRNT